MLISAINTNKNINKNIFLEILNSSSLIYDLIKLSFIKF